MRARTAFGTLALALAGTFLLSSPADAYRTLGGKWSRQRIPVPYSIYDNGFPYGIGMVQKSAYMWGNKPQFRFAFKYAGAASSSNSPQGTHTVYMSGRMNMGVLGVTYPSFSGGTMTHFSMSFNSRQQWSELRFLNTAIHEFGHALGLAHSEKGAAIMNPAGGSGDNLSDLHSDDIAGARYLYPPDGTRPEGDGIVPPGALGKPVIIAPKGQHDGRAPTFTWQAGQGATGYDLLIDSVDANKNQTKLVRTTVTGTSFRAPQALPPGRYYWWVRSKKGTAASDYDFAEFSVVDTTPPPQKPEPISPQGKLTVPVTPTFTWKPALHATAYDFGLDKIAAGNQQQSILRKVVNGTELPLGQTLEPGTYYWWLRARNDVGQSEWAFAQFVVEERQDLPGQPKPLTPRGEIEERAPDFLWTAADKALRYEVVVQQTTSAGTTSEVMRLRGVRGEKLEIGAPMFETGLTYRWWVRGTNEGGPGKWSGHAEFTIKETPIGTPEIIAPSGLISELSPTFTWKPVDDVTHYEIKVHQAEGGKVFAEATIEEAHIASPQALERGKSYWFWVRAWRGKTPGAWASGSFGIPDTLKRNDNDGLIDRLDDETERTDDESDDADDE